MLPYCNSFPRESFIEKWIIGTKQISNKIEAAGRKYHLNFLSVITAAIVRLAAGIFSIPFGLVSCLQNVVLPLRDVEGKKLTKLFLLSTVGSIVLIGKTALDLHQVEYMLPNPDSNENEEYWSKRILQNIDNQKVAQSTNWSMITIRFNQFPPEKISYYLALQLEIAKQIPIEANRPTIDLRIRGENCKIDSNCIGILGGMGPISDAEIMQSAIKKLSDTQMKKLKVDLFSAPPPRTAWQKFQRGIDYLSKVRSFVLRPYIHSVYLTSNTAHVNFSKWSSRCENKLVNMIDIVVTKLTPKAHYLILGTKEAYNKKLYPNKLQAQHIPYSDVSLENSLVLQKIIDHAKANQLSLKDRQCLYQIIEICKLEKRNITHILLGCTELSLVLPNTKELQEKLGVIAVHTEDIFATIISEHLQSKRCSHPCRINNPVKINKSPVK